jgi:hypothetical protein
MLYQEGDQWGDWAALGWLLCGAVCVVLHTCVFVDSCG